MVNINYSAADNYLFSGLTASTNYYFKIYSYNGTSNQKNYKTDGSVPIFNAQTLSSGGGNLSDLIISEYVEGSSNNKAIEIYNGTSAAVDLAAGSYNLKYYFNGSSTPLTTINLTGSILAGNVFVIADASTVSTTILSIANQTNSASWFNGNDAIVLSKGTTILDIIGQVGFDPGTQWGSGNITTLNHTLRRMVSIIQGDTNPSDAFDPAIEWNGFAVDTFDDLGQYEGILPVELTSFAVRTFGNTVLLNWETATEINNYGFDVERCALSAERQAWIKIGFVIGSGNSNSPKSYSFIDDNLPAGRQGVSAGKYAYRLKQIDNDGQFEYSKTIEIEIGAPTNFELSQNYPNPFNPTTTIRYTLPASGNVKLTLYNILGEEIKTLANEFKESGAYTINFDAADLNSGIYIYRIVVSSDKIENGVFTQSKKMTLVK